MEHGLVELATGDIIDDVGAGLDGFAGGEAIAGVDGEKDLGKSLADEGYGLGKSLGLNVGRQQLCAGARGDDTDVDDVGTFGDKLMGVIDKGFGAEVPATVVEGVGGHVEYAHHGRPVEGD